MHSNSVGFSANPIDYRRPFYLFPKDLQCIGKAKNKNNLKVISGRSFRKASKSASSARMPASRLGSLKEIHSLFKSGKLSPSDLLQESKRNFLEHNENGKIFTSHRNWDDLFKQAQESTERYKQKRELSMLDGIPVSLKDNICTTSLPTTCASQALQNYKSPFDATVVEKLNKSGAIVVGKTNMDEFGMGSHNATSFFGSCNNWRVRNSRGAPRSVGGSSGGAAASVLFGCARLALGTDTGGSVRLPASYCGLVAFKPTYGRISRFGVVPYANSLDTVGMIGRSVEDLQVSFDILKGRCPNDLTAVDPPTPSADFIRIAYLSGASSRDLPPPIDSLKPVHIQYGPVGERKTLMDAYRTISCAEAASNLQRYDSVNSWNDPNTRMSTDSIGRFSPQIQGRLEHGREVLLNSPGSLQKSYTVQSDLRDFFAQSFRSFDLIVTEMNIDQIPFLDENLADSLAADQDTIPISLAKLPALCFPIGDRYFQLVSSWGTDESLLSYCRHFS